MASAGSDLMKEVVVGGEGDGRTEMKGDAWREMKRDEASLREMKCEMEGDDGR